MKFITSDRISTKQFGAVISVVAFIIVSLIYILRVSNQIELPRDDAYISFVYAKNWSAGIGPVYNPGEHVEGYTNFLWVVILSIIGKLGFEIPFSAQMISIILGFSALFFSFQITRKILPTDYQSWIAFIPSCLLAINPSFIYWTLYSLETNLVLTLLLICSINLINHLHNNSEKQNYHFIVTGLFLFLLSIARFDSIIVVILLILGTLIADRFINHSLNIKWSVVLITHFLLYFLYSVWRISYYGNLFPNTYYAKAGVIDLITIVRGFEYLKDGIVSSSFNNVWFLIMMIFISIFTLLENTMLRYLPIVAVSLGQLLYVLTIGGDNLGFFRFILPSILMIYVLFAVGIAKIQFKYSSKLKLVSFLIISSILITLASITIEQYPQKIYTRIEYDHTRREIGNILNETTDKSTKIALIPAGIIKYYSNRYAIDMLGLNDYKIAHTDMNGYRGMPGHEKFNSEYVLEREPDIIITQHPLDITNFDELITWGHNKTTTWYSHDMIIDLLTQPNLSEKYNISSLDNKYGILVLKE